MRLSLFTIVFSSVWSLMPWPFVAGRRMNSTRQQLYDYLFDDYNKHIRPSHNSDGPTTIFMAFFLYSVLHLYERDQRLVTAGTVTMVWLDKALEWDPQDYDNITSLTLEQQNVWLPDLNVANSVVSMKQLGYVSVFCPTGEVRTMESFLDAGQALLGAK